MFIEEKGQEPRADSVARFEALFGAPVPDQHRSRTYKFIRWREIIDEHSMDAELIFWCACV